jgi:hypothetical protein
MKLYGETFLAPRSTLKLEDHPLLAAFERIVRIIEGYFP